MTDQSDEKRLDNQRAWDLIRHQRSELHVLGLISDDEYALLAQDHEAVDRLESYDSQAQELAALRVRAEKAENMNKARLDVINHFEKSIAEVEAERDRLAAENKAMREWIEKNAYSYVGIAQKRECDECDRPPGKHKDTCVVGKLLSAHPADSEAKTG